MIGGLLESSECVHQVADSVGVAALTRLASVETTEELLGRADRAAYRAKQAGGNRVCVDDDEPDLVTSR